MKLNNKYYLLRHGEALSNVKNICSSWPETFYNPLTKVGRETIKGIAEKLKNEKVDLIFYSPVLRTKQTADILGASLHIKPKSDKSSTTFAKQLLLEKHGISVKNNINSKSILGPKVVLDKRLREIGFGVFNGKPVEQFQGYFKKPSQKIRKSVPGGESYSDVARRVFLFFKHINKKYKGKTIMIVSHQAPLLLLLGKINKLSIKDSIIPLNIVFKEKRVTNGELVEVN